MPVSGPVVWIFMSSRNAYNTCIMGWGAKMSGRSAQSLWEDRHLSWYINTLEMLAVFQALKHFLPDLRGQHVLVHTDTSVVSYINHQGVSVCAPYTDPSVGQSETFLPEISLHPWASQSGCRHPIDTGAEAQENGGFGGNSARQK